MVICLLFFFPSHELKIQLVIQGSVWFQFWDHIIFQTSTHVKSFVRIQAFFTQVNWPITSWSSEQNYYLVENVRKESMFYNGERGSDSRKRGFFFSFYHTYNHLIRNIKGTLVISWYHTWTAINISYINYIKCIGIITFKTHTQKFLKKHILVVT